MEGVGEAGIPGCGVLPGEGPVEEVGVGVAGVPRCAVLPFSLRESTLGSWSMLSACLSAGLFGRLAGVRPVGEDMNLSRFPATWSGAFSGPRSSRDTLKV